MTRPSTYSRADPVVDLPMRGGPTRASDNTQYLLRSLIFTGRFGPGQKLPPERRLAEMLGTSRMSLRSALLRLEALGFLVPGIGSQGGWWVGDRDSLAACWGTWMQSHTEQVAQMIEFRRVVDAAIVSFAMERRSPQDLEVLEALLAEFKAAGDSFSCPHYAFHRALARASHNEYLEEAAATVTNQLFLPAGWVGQERFAELARHHEALFLAVRDRDAALAADALSAHGEFLSRMFAPASAPTARQMDER
jgi:GntR family transcriptional repressor for pyruvate dehydrogenase complex